MFLNLRQMLLWYARSTKEVLVTFSVQQDCGIWEEGILKIPGLETKPRERKRGKENTKIV